MRGTAAAALAALLFLAPSWALAAAPKVAFSSSVTAGEGGAAYLEKPLNFAVSPDSLHVYVGAEFGVAILEHDAATSSLDYVGEAVNPTEHERNRLVAVSPDGLHVYAYSSSSNSLAIFTRNAGDGSLTFSELLGTADGVPSVAQEWALSADGQSLVMLGGLTFNSILTFSRDAVTGSLTSADSVSENTSGFGFLRWATDLTLSPDSAHIYVSTTLADEVALIDLAGDSTISLVGTYAAPESAYDIVVSADGSRTFLLTSDELRVYDRDAGTGALTLLPHVYPVDESVVSAQRRLAGTPDSSQIAMRDFDGVSVFVAILDVNAGTGAMTLAQTHASSDTGFEFLESSREIAYAPDNSSLFSMNSASDLMASFDRSAVDGSLSAGGGSRHNLGGAAIQQVDGMVLSPDGKHIYAVSENDDALTVFERDAVTGALSLVESHLRLFSAGDELQNPTAVAISPDGLFVYVLAYPGIVTVWSRDVGTGAVALQSTFATPAPDEFNREHLVVTPDGEFLYLGYDFEFGPTAYLLRRNLTTGALALESIEALGTATSSFFMTISPDGQNLYVAGANANGGTDDGLEVFSIDASTGALTLVQAILSPTDPVLDGVEDLEFSADGVDAYMVNGAGRMLAHYKRQPDGSLVLNRTYEEGTEAIVGLTHSDSVAVSPTGESLAAISVGLANFRRVPTTGDLGFVESLGNPVAPGVDVGDAVDSFFGPNGDFIYAAGQSSIAVFELLPTFCPPTPAVTCVAPTDPGKSKISLRDDAKNSKDKMRWQWRKGPTVDAADFGALDTTGAIHVCIYGDAPPVAASPALLWSGSADGGAQCTTTKPDVQRPCWKQSSTKARYKDRSGSPDGLLDVNLKSGATGKAKLAIKAGAELLAFPAGPQPLSVIVQMHSEETGACWETTFSTFKRNEIDRFDARSD